MPTLRAWRVFCAIFVVASLAGCASTQNLTAQNTKFEWTGTQKKVLIVQPDIVLSELTAGGLNEPRADWTQAARAALATAFSADLGKEGVETVALNDLADPHEIQLAKLHAAVGSAILIHGFGPLKLPNKTSALDWTLGPGASALRDHYGADYAMFVYVRDSYATAGRQALEVGSLLVCAAVRVCMGVQGGTTVAFVSLVDLRTGNIVWFNVYGSSVGDLRVAKNIDPFVGSLMKGFPL